jgi:tetratricopeptide (TPR) repeat protein
MVRNTGIDLHLRWYIAGGFFSRMLIQSLLIIVYILSAASAFSQNAPPTSQSSGSSQGGKAIPTATPRPEQNPDNVLNTHTKTVNAIPEDPVPKLVDATLPTSGGIVDLGDFESTSAFARLIEQGQFEEVEPQLIDYLKKKPTSWRAHYFYGYVLLRRLRLTDSLKELAKSLELNTENAEAHKVLGRVLAIAGRYDLALRELDEAQRLTPGSPDVYYNRGRIFSIQDNFHRATQEFETSIHIDPDYMEAFNALGFAMETLGDDAAALTNYRKSIQLNEQQHKQFDAPYVNLSSYYRRIGDSPAALEYALKALELNPQSDLAYYQMAKAYRTMEDWPRMAQALEKAIAINPSSAQYHYVVSFAYRKLGREKESLAAMAEFRRIEQQTAELERRRREARRVPYPDESR